MSRRLLGFLVRFNPLMVRAVSKPLKSAVVLEIPVNNTVKLTEVLRLRVARAMQVEGFSVWSEFCRVALTEKCQAAERELRERDPEAYRQIYGSKSGRDGDGDGD